MKRELKPHYLHRCVSIFFYCKAYPDEKGIETRMYDGWIIAASANCKAYPDEKGIETIFTILYPNQKKYCKAYPDEKGIETDRTARLEEHS